MLRLLTLVCTFAVLAQTTKHPHLEPTPRHFDNGNLLNGWSPKPTQAPQMRERYGSLEMNDLFRRLSIETCGYTSGDQSQPFTCDGGQGCAYLLGASPQCKCTYRSLVRRR